MSQANAQLTDESIDTGDGSRYVCATSERGTYYYEPTTRTYSYVQGRIVVKMWRNDVPKTSYVAAVTAAWKSLARQRVKAEKAAERERIKAEKAAAKAAAAATKPARSRRSGAKAADLPVPVA